jgi:hypothetical protein
MVKPELLQLLNAIPEKKTGSGIPMKGANVK